MKTYLQFVTEDTAHGLYSFRKLNKSSVEYLHHWQDENNIPNSTPPTELHCTILCSDVAVPGYTVDPTPVLLDPKTFGIKMLNEALVLTFKSSSLEEQWQQGMNLGAIYKWPTFVPHISLSYKVPIDYDYSDLKPPPVHIILDGEQSRLMVDGWASVADDAIQESTETIYLPKNSLNFPHSEMPQISKQNLMEFIDWIENRGTLVQYIDIPVSMLKSSQDKINTKKIGSFTIEQATSNPLIISKDNYILDGHHRWIKILNKNPQSIVEAYRINLPFTELLQLSRTYT